MNASRSRKPSREHTWPRKVTVGREIVSIYRRKTPQGNFAYMVANYAAGRRRFDSYAAESDALEAANALARSLSKRDVLAASITRDQAVEFASALQTLQPFNVSLPATAATVAECLKIVGDLSNLHAAVKFYAARNKQTVRKTVANVVAELLAIKESRGASTRYMQDLRYRLNRFTADCVRGRSKGTT